MDGICSAVLNKINALGAPGRYFVVASDEFFDAFPEDGNKNEGELKRALKELSANGYIDIKYSSGNLYCVALLKEFILEETPPQTCDSDGSEEYCDPLEEEKTAHVSLFFAAFAGSALGSAVIGAIFLILNFIV